MLKGTIIYQSATPFGPIKVVENKTVRWISFDNEFVQTIIDKKQPHLAQLLYLPSFCCVLKNNHEKVLLLGAGGGGLLHYLKYHFPHQPIEAVELSEEIIHIAKTYFNIQQPIIQGCAFQHIQHCEPAAHIFVDLLTGRMTPDALNNVSFYENCYKKALNTVSFNLISRNSDDMLSMLNIVSKVFHQKTLCLPVKTKKNVILIAFKHKTYLNEIDDLVKKKIIAPPIWDEYYGLISECPPPKK